MPARCRSGFTPRSLGAPAKFARWRDEQLDAIQCDSDTDKFATLITAPTGVGKSVMAWGSHALTGDRTLILTKTRSLEDMYEDDFGTAGLVDIRGQQNYICHALAPGGKFERYNAIGRTCDRGPCHFNVACHLAGGGCDYFDKVRDAGRAGLVSSNYSYHISAGKSLMSGRAKEEPLSEFERLVCDEAHDVPDEVCRLLTVELSPKLVRDIAGMRTLRDDANCDDWRTWGQRGLDIVNELTNQHRSGLFGLSTSSVAMSSSLRTLREQCETLANMDDWVITHERRRRRRNEHANVYDRLGDEIIKFEPVWPTPYVRPLLFRGAEHVMLMSATVTPAILPKLDLDPAETLILEYDSPFPVARRPIYVAKGMRPRVAVDAKMSDADIKIWISRMDAYMQPRVQAGRNGVIHCVSYERAKQILTMSRHRHRIIAAIDRDHAAEAVEEFKSRPNEGLILLHPAVEQGESFDGDMCRWILVAKLPFPPTQSPVMKRRCAEDKTYYAQVMMTKLVQSCGRGNRSVDDWCEMFIVDQHAEWALPTYRDFAPKFFNEALIYTSSMPPMLELAA